MTSLQRGVFNVVKCAHMQSSKKVHRSFVRRSNSEWLTSGWEFISSRNPQWSKGKFLKDRESAVIPFIVFNTRFYFNSSCCNGPTTTTQMRVADTPVGPHTLDTASIWQQTLSAGRRAVRSPPQIENKPQMENYVWPIRWGLLAQLNSFTPNWDKHMLMHLALTRLM